MTKSIRVLLADDHTLVRAGLRGLLQGIAGVEVVGEAEDGHEALRLAAELRPDVVLLDIGMPGLNGYEVCKKLRERTANAARRPTIVALTGWGQEEDRRRSKEAGFDRHLVKPVEPAELRGLLAETHRAVT